MKRTEMGAAEGENRGCASARVDGDARQFEGGAFRNGFSLGGFFHGALVRGALAGAGLALLAGGAPAQADVVRDLLGVNPFASESSSTGLRSGVVVDESDEEIYCPRVDVFEGGSIMRRGEGKGLAYQLTIGDLARECVRGPGGLPHVNVGVDVRAVLGPAGRAGRFTAPVTILVKQGDTVLARVTRQVALSVVAGETNAVGAIVEQGIALPENTHNVVIEVGFGGAAPKGRKRGR